MPQPPTVVWITSGFPYGQGEQFIESEVSHWSSFDGGVRLLPENAMGLSAARPTPSDVAVDTGLLECWNARGAQLASAFRAFFSPIFWHEVKHIIKAKKVSSYTIKHAFLSVTRMQMELRQLRRIVKEIGGPIDVVYTYWMSVGTFTACLAKRKGLVRRVISRAHRHEFYEEVRPEQYTALVRQFVPEVDTLAVISDDAAAYSSHYGFTPDQVKVCRLGVKPGPMAATSEPGTLVLMSVSTLSPPKQLHIMIDAVGEVAKALPEYTVVWRHAGDGPLRDQLYAQAAKLDSLPNLKREMLGHVTNPDLLAQYATKPVDIFLNSSEHEGVPVSIMEAMVRGIPSIAPDVGAIRELVPTELLLPPHITPTDMSERILAFHERAKDPVFREHIRDLATADYDADTNYRDFVAHVNTLAGNPK